MYFEDLSEYRYDVRLDGVLHVGWLDDDHPFPTGTIEPHLVRKLARLVIESSANQMRGFHVCRFCEQVEDARGFPADQFVEVDGKRALLGSAEIWVPDPDGVRIYAAPTLIVHYVERHAYLPPRAFLDALEAHDPARWDGRAEADARVMGGWREAARRIGALPKE